MFAIIQKRQWPAFAVLILSLTASIAHAQDPKPNCYVLAVGVDKYQNIGQLNGCVNDANNAAESFRRQEGPLFTKVTSTVLVDAQANTQRIDQDMKSLATVGKSGDFVVLFLSGHGNRVNKKWAFIPQDFVANQYARTTISEESILQWADAQAAQGKKVCIMVDACFAGQLRLSAKHLLARYRDPRAGGIILMVSSMPNQVSAACGAYSAFAFAIKEGMDGKADYNGDGQITLQELRRYAYHRVYELQKGDQDGEIDYSLSLSDSMVVAKVVQGSVAASQPVVNPKHAQEKVIKGELHAKDVFDRLRKGSYAKVYTVEMNVGKVVIDLTSGFFDTYLRIEDLNGNVLAENDDFGGTLNSQVTLDITRAGQLRIVVTSYAPGVTGNFEVRIR
jgi:uncharacterized caspase-like protein